MSVIVLDAGHGGKDSGTSGFGLVEKDLALDITKKVYAVLSESSMEVHITRTTDTFIALSERVRMANVYGANLFVSLHHNEGGGEGFESYIYPGLRNTKLGKFSV
jgi:N-acetylmuramoyl-L-alanine amidase